MEQIAIERETFLSTYAESVLLVLHWMNAPEVWQLCPTEAYNESERFKLRSHDYNYSLPDHPMNYSICLLPGRSDVRDAHIHSNSIN